MMSSAGEAIGRLRESHERIEQRMRALGSSPEDVLELGQAVLEFGAREDEAFAALSAIIDPAVRAELAAEHRRLAEDLELLEWLLRTCPESTDVGMLTDALVRRIRDHLQRDGRLLARAAGM